MAIPADHIHGGQAGQPFGAPAEKKDFPVQIVGQDPLGKVVDDPFDVHFVVEKGLVVSLAQQIGNKALDSEGRFAKGFVLGFRVPGRLGRIGHGPLHQGRKAGQPGERFLRSPAEGNGQVEMAHLQIRCRFGSVAGDIDAVFAHHLNGHGMEFRAGSIPALKTAISSPAICLAKPSAIWLLAAFFLHRKRMEPLFICFITPGKAFRG